MKWFWFIVLSMSQTGCLSALLGSSDSKSRTYKLASPGAGWIAIDPVDADAAYRHQGDGTVINVSSFCGDERLRPLEELAEDVLRQLPEATVQGDFQKQTVGGFPALVGQAQGRVDANTIDVSFAVIRSSRCVYDFILAGPKANETSRLAFDRALQDFREAP